VSAQAALLPLADAIAVVDEERCIGCTLCIHACPVDAIVGAAKLMHTVISAACTGCELCVPPCPVDCIDILAITPRNEPARDAATAAAQRRHEARNARLAHLAEEKAAKSEEAATRRKRETIARAVERARLRLENRKP
jgi:electron transport complex protein RnfB